VAGKADNFSLKHFGVFGKSSTPSNNNTTCTSRFEMRVGRGMRCNKFIVILHFGSRETKSKAMTTVSRRVYIVSLFLECVLSCNFSMEDHAGRNATKTKREPDVFDLHQTSNNAEDTQPQHE
jgi:hypothetical protein